MTAIYEARNTLEPALREGGNLFGLATGLGMLGTIRTLAGDPAAGAEELAEGVAPAERLGLPELIAAIASQFSTPPDSTSRPHALPAGR
jgi:hypothetical protein